MDLQFKTRNPKQVAAAEAWIDHTTEEILYGGAKGGGKSFLGANLIFGDALLYENTHYFIARKELIDLRKFTIPTVHKVFEKWGLTLDTIAENGKPLASYNGQDNYFRLYNDSLVFLIACKDEPSDPLFERFGSMEMTRGWLEEGGEIPEAAKANLWLSIGRWRNDEFNLKKKLLVTANPKKGWMKRDFVDPYKKDLLPKSRRYIQAFATDNTYLPEDYVASLRNEKDKVRRQRLWEGNWDYEDDNDSLITFDSLSDSFTNTLEKDGNKYLTVDIARKGRDKTVLSFWEGLELYKVKEYSKQATNTTEQKIIDEAAAERIPYSHILIDEDGIGGGVVDHLLGVKGFVAKSTPVPTANQIRERLSKVEHSLIPKTVYAGLKSQCGWKLAEMINEHSIAFKVPEYRETIVEELSALLRDKEMDGDGKKQLKPKKEVKAALGKSPDLGDTIIMRAYFELIKDSTGKTDQQVTQAVEEQTIRLNRNTKNIRLNSTK